MRRSTALKAAAGLLVLLSLAATYLSIMSYWEKREEEIHGMFMEYKASCNKIYNSTAGEEEYRYGVFKENFRRGHNVRVCIFGDMTKDEVNAWNPGEALTLEESYQQQQQAVLPLVEEGREWDGRGGSVSIY